MVRFYYLIVSALLLWIVNITKIGTYLTFNYKSLQILKKKPDQRFYSGLVNINNTTFTTLVLQGIYQYTGTVNLQML